MRKNNFIEYREAVDNIPYLSLFEQKMSVVFPKEYKGMVSIRDGGILDKDIFIYKGIDSFYSNCIGRFLYLNDNDKYSYYSYMLNVYNDPPEFFPDGLIPFAPDGGGNYICFDYRNCKENPPIVFWDHGVEENEGIFYLADSFNEFINNLKSEEEIEEELKRLNDSHA